MDDKVSKCENCEYFEETKTRAICRCGKCCELRDEIRDAYSKLVDEISEVVKVKSKIGLKAKRKIILARVDEYLDLNGLRVK